MQGQRKFNLQYFHLKEDEDIDSVMKEWLKDNEHIIIIHTFEYKDYYMAIFTSKIGGF